MAQTPADPFAILRHARERLSQVEVARILHRDARTVRRWERREVPPPALIVPALREALAANYTPHPGKGELEFVDLFAGIGGLRLGFEAVGAKCVFTSEWNPWAVRTYAANFGEDADHPIHGDITKIEAAVIPDHDMLLAGFPCQPFSLAGVSKKMALSRPHGFRCAAQGTLFFEVARIIAKKRPTAFLLENVKNLVSHDGGKTLRVILHTLGDKLGYEVHWKVIDGGKWVPQHRERIYILGFDGRTDFSWNALRVPERAPVLASVLHRGDGSQPLHKSDHGRFVDARGRVLPKYGLTDALWRYLQEYAERHRAKGNGFGFGLVGPGDVARTLSARYHKDGSEILVARRGRNPRRLTPRECARLMGFPDSYRIVVSDTQAYRQFGNSVVVPAVREIARIMVPHVSALRDGVSQGLLFPARLP